jgi:nitrate/nitrite transporter NarK
LSRATGIPRSTLHQHGFLAAFQVLAGLFFSAIGGYIASRIAAHDELLNGGLSAILCVVVSSFVVLFGHGNKLGALIPLLAAPAFGVLGGYLGLRQKIKLVRSRI